MQTKDFKGQDLRERSFKKSEFNGEIKMNIETVANQALKLNVNARAYLAQVLLESLDYEEEIIISSQWRQEIKKRCDEIKNSPDILIDGKSFLSALKGQYL